MSIPYKKRASLAMFTLADRHFFLQIHNVFAYFFVFSRKNIEFYKNT